LFKGYIDTTCINKELKLISNIVIYLNGRKEGSFTALITFMRSKQEQFELEDQLFPTWRD
jgi:hypothetical protein